MKERISEAHLYVDDVLRTALCLTYYYHEVFCKHLSLFSLNNPPGRHSGWLGLHQLLWCVHHKIAIINVIKKCALQIHFWGKGIPVLLYLPQVKSLTTRKQKPVYTFDGLWTMACDICNCSSGMMYVDCGYKSVVKNMWFDAVEGKVDLHRKSTEWCWSNSLLKQQFHCQ